ncbi:hypothetical protein scyTo_0003177 [Scyliorhinus torazame]|uniref:Uncharacterized protein n=1 Tax=Scyliorhinus torazame TaxID=75743 RepID=A0A401PLT4_SCYTO|nr:hypothetical protein [Scyliorhinus torazame]
MDIVIEFSVSGEITFLIKESPNWLNEPLTAENNLEDEDMLHFAEGLQNNSSLKVLKLANNRISRKGLELIIKSLKHNVTITSVWVGGNHVTAEEIEDMTRAERRLAF